MAQAAWNNLVVPRGRVIAVIPFVVVVYLLLAFVAYSAFTSQIPSGNDFYPRWKGTRSLLLEGKDPYSDEVTLAIQQGVYGRPATEDEDQVAFAYPLYVSLFVLPFSLFPYAQAQALWLSALILLTLGSVIVVPRTLDWRLSLAGFTALSLWCVFFYPTARSIVLGQVSIVVLLLLAVALWAMQQRHAFLAGCSLALATIKPQMVFLVIPFLLLIALRRKNYRLAAAFLAVMAILLFFSSLVLPSWLQSFITGLGRYQAYTSIYREGRSPLGVVMGYLFPSLLSPWATLSASLALVGYMVYVWIQSLRERIGVCEALSTTIVVTLLVPAQTGTTNQVLLLLPLFYWLYQWHRNRVPALSLSLVVLVGPWMLFLLTFWQRNGEHAIVAAPLPLLTLAMVWWKKTRTDETLRLRAG